MSTLVSYLVTHSHGDLSVLRWLLCLGGAAWLVTVYLAVRSIFTLEE
jgi:hypothetical protein